MSAGGRRRVLSGEERVLWAAITKTIEPLKAGAHFDAGDAAIPNVVSPPRAKATAVAPQPAPAKPSPPSLAPPLAPLGRRMKQRVARGKEAIDARIDLHGLTQAQAHSALLHFLRNAQARDARLLLVITGKGRGAEPGVLRRQVPQWLGLPEFRSLVVGFEDAHIAHGGAGALYVRVRRTRPG
ncbi:MAG TPA: Smr/MutS family protein [Pseudolabrys sp.]|nr:Smr/MutS family protein [Pseudolabrys sp.]